MNLFGKILVNQQNFLDQDDETGLNDGEAKRMFLLTTNLIRCQMAVKCFLSFSHSSWVLFCIENIIQGSWPFENSTSI